MFCSILEKAKPGFLILFIFCFTEISTEAQQKRRFPPNSQTIKRAVPATAIVVDERLSVLRFEPSLYAIPLQRMRSGRTMQIIGEREADGVKFYRVELAGEKSGWVQSEAVVSNARRGDDERLAKLIRAESGFEQLELASIFLENFPISAFRPAILLLAGDLAEDAAQRLTREAARKLNQAEMQSSGAPIHSFYLNYSGLDRYRRLGLNFIFDNAQKQFHYDGTAWREILQKHPKAAETAEARKRLDSLTAMMKTERD